MSGKSEDETYQGWEVTAVVHSDAALCGEEHEVYIIKAETKQEAHEEVLSKRAVKRVETDLTQSIEVDEEGLRVIRV